VLEDEIHESRKLSDLTARLVEIPMERPRKTGGGAISSFPFVLLDLTTDEGVVGSSYLFSYDLIVARTLMTLLGELREVVRGCDASPQGLKRELETRFRLFGVGGLLRFALGAIDVAAWDARARARKQPLAVLLGGKVKPVPAYASFFMDGVEGAKRDAESARALGYHAAKFKIGYPSVEEDLEVVRAVRRIMGDSAKIMVDYNQSLSVTEAVARLDHLGGEEIYWAEEPTRWDDTAGNAEIVRRVEIPVQLGENWWSLDDMTRSLTAGGSKYAMLNLLRMGGVTGWLQAAALAAEAEIPLSSHSYQTVCSHLLCLAPTAHWLECSGKINPILARHLEIEDGCALPIDAPGSGLAWNEERVTQYRIA
jgi:mandelate racemase